MSYWVYMLNISIDVFVFAIGVIGLITSLYNSRSDKTVEKHFIVIFIYMLLYVSSNLAGLLMRGMPGPTYRIALYFVNFCEFLFCTMLGHKVSVYMTDICIQDEKHDRDVRSLLNLLLVFQVVALLISQFTGLFYTINENNFYVRGIYYPLVYLMPALMFIIDIIVLRRTQKNLSGKLKTAFWMYLLLPFVAGVLQIRFYGINFLVMATVIGGVILFMLMVIDQSEKNLQNEIEMEKVKSNLLLGQMSPHFVFNSLMSIQDLCYDDPQTAAEGIGDFAVYLRKNMEDMTSKEMIPFEKEVDFIREYVSLEKLDPARQFTVNYDLEETDFVIPTLTLQPVVENAINYGALTMPQGKGEVDIFTSRKGDDIVITVRNNYEHTSSSTGGQRKHRGIALENLKTRLQYYCDGSFEINIYDDEAIAEIRLPYEKVKGGQADENDYH